MLILCLFKFMNMNNLQSGLLFSLTGITAVASLSSCASQKKTEEQKPYNIVYIMTDDHTAQMMSCYDKRYMETPNLDRIANDGVRFTNSFVANSLSGPSRACMITGKHSCANKFYDNTTCIFDGSQQTFPKLLQQAGYQTALIGKWHLESLPTGFNYWEIVPGQGDYYNPDFITQDNDTIQKHGYITNIITDDAIDWMENKRDKDKPFCILIHHKAIHRNWLADTCNLSLYEDKTFPLPDNFFDDYEGRPAAAAQEMSIVKDMDMIYDLKMLRPDKQTRLKALYENYIGRMDEGQRAAWDKFYGPIIDDFYKKNPQGKELADWKFQRYMRDYMKTVKSLDDNVGRVLDYLKEKLLRQIGFSEESYIIEDPFGTSMGGSGLMATPEDLLRTGCMLLKQEKDSYAARATEPRTATQLDGDDRWYGYQFWIPMEGTFAMLGLGGQIMLAVPEMDLVVVTTADTQGMGGAEQMILAAVREVLLKDCFPENDVEKTTLPVLRTVFEGKPCADFGKKYPLLRNRYGFTWCGVTFSEANQKGVLSYEIEGRECQFPFGIGHLEEGEFPIYKEKCASSGAWMDQHTLFIFCWLIGESVASIRFRLYFSEDGLTIHMNKTEETKYNEYMGFLNS